MRAVVQRVTQASVDVVADDGSVETVGAIGPGLCVLVGVTHDDTPEVAAKVADKIWHLRVFDDDAGVMNRSAADIDAEILVVSQFTLYGDTSGGPPAELDRRRPPRASPNRSSSTSSTRLRSLGATVATGRFRTEMRVSLVNDGPVTVLHRPLTRPALTAAPASGSRRTAAADATSSTRSTMNGRSPSVTYHVSPVRSSTSWRMTARSLTAVRSITSPSGRDELREPGRRRLHDPPSGLDRPQPARRDLLRLHDRARVAGAVRRVEDDARAPRARPRGRGHRRTPPTRSRPPTRVPSGRSSTAGVVPATASWGTWSTGAPSASSRPRSGTYSPNGTRRTLS